MLHFVCVCFCRLLIINDVSEEFDECRKWYNSAVWTSLAADISICRLYQNAMSLASCKEEDTSHWTRVAALPLRAVVVRECDGGWMQ